MKTGNKLQNSAGLVAYAVDRGWRGELRHKHPSGTPSLSRKWVDSASLRPERYRCTLSLSACSGTLTNPVGSARLAMHENTHWRSQKSDWNRFALYFLHDTRLLGLVVVVVVVTDGFWQNVRARSGQGGDLQNFARSVFAKKVLRKHGSARLLGWDSLPGRTRDLPFPRARTVT